MYAIGMALENYWGSFKFNVYFFIGYLDYFFVFFVNNYNLV